MTCKIGLEIVVEAEDVVEMAHLLSSLSVQLERAGLGCDGRTVAEVIAAKLAAAAPQFVPPPKPGV